MDDREGLMDLRLFLNGLTWSGSLKPALQAGLVATAAMAGYVTFMPLPPKSAATGTTGTFVTAEQPLWAGLIERPDVDTPPPPEPATSASYVVQEPVLTHNASKALGPVSAALLPKAPLGKPVSPPRRPQLAEDTSNRAAAVITPASVVMSDPEVKPAQRNLLSPVTDRLPATGVLLKPIHAFGDAVHNLIKSF